MSARGKLPTGVKVYHRLPLSSDHLEAAVFFAALAREFEQGRAKALVLHPRSEHRAAALACILSAVGYLEATVNEDITDAVDEGIGEGIIGTPVVIERLRGIWGAGASK